MSIPKGAVFSDSGQVVTKTWNFEPEYFDCSTLEEEAEDNGASRSLAATPKSEEGGFLREQQNENASFGQVLTEFAQERNVSDVLQPKNTVRDQKFKQPPKIISDGDSAPFSPSSGGIKTVFEDEPSEHGVPKYMFVPKTRAAEVKDLINKGSPVISDLHEPHTPGRMERERSETSSAPPTIAINEGPELHHKANIVESAPRSDEQIAVPGTEIPESEQQANAMETHVDSADADATLAHETSAEIPTTVSPEREPGTLMISFTPQASMGAGDDVRLVLHEYEGPDDSSFPVDCDPPGMSTSASWSSKSKELQLVLDKRVEMDQPIKIFIPPSSGIRSLSNISDSHSQGASAAPLVPENSMVARAPSVVRTPSHAVELPADQPSEAFDGKQRESGTIMITFTPPAPMDAGDIVILEVPEYEGPNDSTFPVECEPLDVTSSASWLSKSKELQMVLCTSVQMDRPIKIFIPPAAGFRSLASIRDPQSQGASAAPLVPENSMVVQTPQSQDAPASPFGKSEIEQKQRELQIFEQSRGKPVQSTAELDTARSTESEVIVTRVPTIPTVGVTDSAEVDEEPDGRPDAARSRSAEDDEEAPKSAAEGLVSEYLTQGYTVDGGESKEVEAAAEEAASRRDSGLRMPLTRHEVSPGKGLEPTERVVEREAVVVVEGQGLMEPSENTIPQVIANASPFVGKLKADEVGTDDSPTRNLRNTDGDGADKEEEDLDAQTVGTAPALIYDPTVQQEAEVESAEAAGTDSADAMLYKHVAGDALPPPDGTTAKDEWARDIASKVSELSAASAEEEKRRSFHRIFAEYSLLSPPPSAAPEPHAPQRSAEPASDFAATAAAPASSDVRGLLPDRRVATAAAHPPQSGAAPTSPSRDVSLALADSSPQARTLSSMATQTPAETATQTDDPEHSKGFFDEWVEWAGGCVRRDPAAPEEALLPPEPSQGHRDEQQRQRRSIPASLPTEPRSDRSTKRQSPKATYYTF